MHFLDSACSGLDAVGQFTDATRQAIVFCVTPVLRTGYVVMVEGLTCPHGWLQYGCCVVVCTLSWPWMSVGRLRDTALVRCDIVCYWGWSAG